MKFMSYVFYLTDVKKQVQSSSGKLLMIIRQQQTHMYFMPLQMTLDIKWLCWECWWGSSQSSSGIHSCNNCPRHVCSYVQCELYCI